MRKSYYTPIYTAARFIVYHTAESHYNTGKIYIRLGCDADALEEFRSAVQLDNQYRDAWHSFAETYSRLRLTFKSGSPERQQAKADIVHAYSVAANLFQEANMFEAALDAYKKIRLLNPAYPNLHSQMAMILRKLGMIEEAKQILKQAGLGTKRKITLYPSKKIRQQNWRKL